MPELTDEELLVERLEKAVEFAIDSYASPSDGDISVHSDATAEESGDGGFWVEARVYVRLSDIEPEVIV